MSNVDEPHTAYQWNRITPIIASNNMDSQYEQQYSRANSIAAFIAVTVPCQCLLHKQE